MSRRILYRAIWIPSAIIFLFLTAAFARQPYTVQPPGKTMETYTTSDKTIQVSHPDNWKPLQTAAHDTVTKLKFEPSRFVRITIGTDLMGSLMGDISKSQNDQLSSLNAMPGMPQQSVEKQKSPLEKVHEASCAELSKNLDGYQAGETKPIQVAGQEALMTDYTFHEAGLWGPREMVGKRITALLTERRLTVDYRCLKESEGIITPVFMQMLESLRVNTTGG